MTENKNAFDLFSLDNSPDFDSEGTAGLFELPDSNPLFDLPASEPVVVQVKAEEEAPVVPVKKEAAKPAAADKKAKDPKLSKEIKKQVDRVKSIKVDTTWNIAYAAHQYNPPENDMTLEQVRQYLELDYPELSQERCRMEIDEAKKLIVPIVKGSKNG